jgi:hypothetical protein
MSLCRVSLRSESRRRKCLKVPNAAAYCAKPSITISKSFLSIPVDEKWGKRNVLADLDLSSNLTRPSLRDPVEENERPLGLLSEKFVRERELLLKFELDLHVVFHLEREQKLETAWVRPEVNARKLFKAVSCKFS